MPQKSLWVTDYAVLETFIPSKLKSLKKLLILGWLCYVNKHVDKYKE